MGQNCKILVYIFFFFHLMREMGSNMKLEEQNEESICLVPDRSLLNRVAQAKITNLNLQHITQ